MPRIYAEHVSDTNNFQAGAGLAEKFTLEFGKVREEIGEGTDLLVASYRDLARRLNRS